MKIHRRNTLWFGKYDRCIRFYLPESFVLRKLNHNYIDQVIQRRREWAFKISGRNPQPGSWMHSWAKIEITDDQVQNLHEFCDFLLDDQRPRKMTISGDWIYLYTTDQTLVDDVRQLNYLDRDKISVHHAQQVGTPGTVRLREVRNRYRSYFRHTPLDTQKRQNLRDFLQAQEGVRLGPALADALDSDRTKRLFDYYFIDHDDSGIITMLNLVVPGAIRRTLPIVADK